MSIIVKVIISEILVLIISLGYSYKLMFNTNYLQLYWTLRLCYNFGRVLLYTGCSGTLIEIRGPETEENSKHTASCYGKCVNWELYELMMSGRELYILRVEGIAYNAFQVSNILNVHSYT